MTIPQQVEPDDQRNAQSRARMDIRDFKHEIDTRKADFLDAYIEGRTVTYGAKAIGVDRRRVYEWLKDDAVFAEEFQHAREQIADGLRKHAFDMATKAGIDGDPHMLRYLMSMLDPEFKDKGKSVEVKSNDVEFKVVWEDGVI